MKQFYMSTYFAASLIAAFLFLGQLVQAQSKSDLNHAKEILAEQTFESQRIGNQRIEIETGISRAIYSPGIKLPPAEPRLMAEQYLLQSAPVLMRKSNISDIDHQRTIETPGGYKVHFVQKAGGYPVFGATINVSINRKDEVVFVTNSYKLLGELQTAINISQRAAAEMAKNYIGISGKLSFEKVETVVYNIDMSKSVVAHQVNMIPAEDNFGDWEILVDASSGEILRAEDKACYHHPDGDGVTGSGWVFDPDPTTNVKKSYGSAGFTDNGDADSDSLTAQLKQVDLRDISFDGTNYKLEGPYAVIVDVESPFTGLFEQDSPDFHYTRSNQAFEATMVYYHVDNSMRYVNDSLGFDVMPIQYEGGVQFDPHGLDNGVNAWYTSAGYIAFGSPPNNVDTGEDHAIVLHELGHAIHDWITDGNLSQVDGLSEGSSDYWAQSYTRSLGIYEPDDNGYDWFGVWGLQPVQQGPTLRVTNIGTHYPEDLVGQVHTDGQMWSSSVMSIYDMIGKYKCDMNFLEAMSMLNGNSNQVDAAMAFMQADKDLFDGENIDDIFPVFYTRGYIEDVIAVEFSADQSSGEGPLTVNFTDASLSFLGDITEWEWDLDGDGIVDSHDQNPSFTYEEVGAYNVSLKVSDGENINAIVKANYIIVNGGFFVFESAENVRDYSGTYIKGFLEDRGYPVIYSNNYPTSFKGFDAIFISCGNFGSSFTIMDDEMTAAMINYMKEGGNVFLESASNLGYFQNDNSELLELFGLVTAQPGSTNYINGLSGIDGTITEGLQFNGSNQQGARFIERYVPDDLGSSFVAFSESDYGDVAVQNTGMVYGNKTFCFAYALAELQDQDPSMSRHHFMVRLMDFFGFPEPDNYVVANFNSSSSSVMPNEEIEFTDQSFSAEGTSVNAWAWDFDMDGNIDSYDQNPSYTYSSGGVFDVMLVASNGIVEDTIIKEDFVAVRSGILVYEGKSGVNGYSGNFIKEYLDSNYYDEVGYTNNFPESLEGYDAVFLSFGNAGNQSTIINGQMAKAIEDYGLSGGNIYVEGGDALSQAEAAWLIFGLIDVENGQNHSIDVLAGQQSSLAEGIQFNGSTQFTNNSIDILVKIEDVPVIQNAFVEGFYGNVAVQFDGTDLFGQKTFCMSYALSELEDGDGMNTRDELLLRILNFFDVVTDVSESSFADAGLLKVFPNPAKDQINLEFELEKEGAVNIKMYDLSGRAILANSHQLSRGKHHLNYNIQAMPSGIYYFNLQSENLTETIKWLKID